jgi:antirestriction protein ArdC
LVPKAHTVFNIDQTEGIAFPKVSTCIKSQNKAIEACEQVVTDMQNRPTSLTNGSQAYYTQVSDVVVVTNLQSFTSAEEYYNTLFH